MSTVGTIEADCVCSETRADVDGTHLPKYSTHVRPIRVGANHTQSHRTSVPLLDL